MIHVPEFITDIGSFLVAVFWRWQSWVGGSGVGGAIAVLISLWERMSGRAMDKRMYFSIVVGAFLFGAFFLAWQDKAHELSKLQEKLRTPDLSSAEMPTVITVNMNGHPVVIFGGSIRNPTGPTSGLMKWRMYVKMPNGALINGNLRGTPGKDLLLPLPNLKSQIMFRADDYWPKATAKVIPAGESANGWIMGVFDGHDLDKLGDENGTINVEFSDIVSGHMHKIEVPLTGRHIPGPLDVGPYQ